MIGSRRTQVLQQRSMKYATPEDFCAVFAQHVDELYQLAFLLTADHYAAQECFVAALEDSKKENHVFKEWARSWAKRAIIQNAIRRIKPRPNVVFFPLVPTSYFSPPSDPKKTFEVDAVLALEDFERFVFVMSVLEHYSEHECSLLLACSPRHIREARGQAFGRLLSSPGTVLPADVSSASVHELFG